MSNRTINFHQLRHEPIIAIAALGLLLFVLLQFVASSVREALLSLGLIVFTCTGLAWVELAIRKKVVTVFEFSTMAAINFLLLLPLLLWLCSLLFSGLAPWFLGLISAVVALGMFTVWLAGGRLVVSSSPRSSYLFLVVAILLTAVIAIFSTLAFMALPDLDPYYCVKAYTQEVLQQGHIDGVVMRPLFYAHVFLWQGIVGLPTLAVFKYIIPWLNILVVFPVCLSLQHVQTWWQRAVLLFIPLASPALVVYENVPIPQATLIIFVVYYVFLSLHASSTRDLFWHYVAGAGALIAVLYQETALVLVVTWLAVTVAWLVRQRMVWTWLGKNRLRVFLLSLGGILLAVALWRWVRALIVYMAWLVYRMLDDVHINFLFPAHYTNIDGVENGWPGSVGVLKYYLFYVGPFTLLTGFTIVLLVWKREQRRIILNWIWRSPATKTLFIGWLIFFILAEILPRIAGIALLPDRAWLFSTLLGSVWLYAAWGNGYLQRRLWLIAALAMLSISIISGLTIHASKRHVVPDYQVRVALWMRDNVPADALIVTQQSSDYIDVYSQRKFAGLPQDFFCGDDVSPVSTWTRLRTLYPEPRDNLYFLAYTVDGLNPYRYRSWARVHQVECTAPLFARRNDYFKKIYSAAGEATLWRVR